MTVCHMTLCHLSPACVEAVVYDGSPTRPREITREDREANDMPIDDNTQLVISLDVLFHEDGEKEEEVLRLVQVATPTGIGQQRNCYLLVTSQATYILRKGMSMSKGVTRMESVFGMECGICLGYVIPNDHTH